MSHPPATDVSGLRAKVESYRKERRKSIQRRWNPEEDYSSKCCAKEAPSGEINCEWI